MLYRPYGPSAWLIEDIDDPTAWAAGLERMAQLGVQAIVPAKETVLVLCERVVHDEVGRLFDQVRPIRHRDDEQELTIEVVYDGDDLAKVAEELGLSADAVVERHTAARYTVEFCGFSPGFAYLGGLDPVLRIPRRDSPRTRVPTGSVAIAADYSCIYPSPSPGGWHLLGSTTADVWDIRRSVLGLCKNVVCWALRQVRP